MKRKYGTADFFKDTEEQTSDSKRLQPSLQYDLAQLSIQPTSPNNDNSNNSNSNLCARCISIDFDAIFSIDTKKIERNGMELLALGILKPDQRQSECRLCALFASSAFGPLGATIVEVGKDVKENQQWHLRAFSSLRMFNLSRSQRRLRKASSIIFNIVPAGTSNIRRWSLNNFEFRCGNVILPIDPEPKMDKCSSTFAYEGRLINSIGIDYDVIKDWLANCRANHKKSCSLVKESQATASRFVNCRTKKVVPAAADMRYFTLSYVWGPDPTLESLDPPDSEHCQQLPDNLPNTIADAIKVVLALGECFLWIDRYCVDQEPNSTMREAELMRMDKIFEGAIACLVAAGPDATSGLYGVHETPRLQQPQVNLGKRLLVSSLPRVSTYLKDSKWTYRGWTYQEAQLSRRCVIFTKAQVYFVCRQERQAETVQLGLLNSSDRRNYRQTLMEPNAFETKFNTCRRHTEATYFDLKLFDYYEGMNTLLNAETPDSPSQIKISEGSERLLRWNHTSGIQPNLQVQLLEYTERALTYDSDALNAFRGVLSRAGNLTYFGIPLVLTLPLPEGDTFDAQVNLGFSIGMAWARFKGSRIFSEQATQAENPVDRRRQSFPSWSWNSIRGTTGFALANEFVHSTEYLTIPEAQFSRSPTYYFQEDTGNIHSMAKEFDRQRPTGKFIILERSRFLVLRCLLAKCKVIYTQANGLQCLDSDSLAPLFPVQSPSKVHRSKRPVLDLFLDNTTFDIDRARELATTYPSAQVMWDLILLFQKESKGQNYQTCWWILVYWADGIHYRVGLVRTWSALGEGLPVEERVTRLG